ncbi:MAG: hypothetical protein VX527_04750 [Planctomycetota bacterium]|nr:hypothetical protein [Planctomycetota bacterium]
MTEQRNALAQVFAACWKDEALKALRSTLVTLSLGSGNTPPKTRPIASL